MTTLESFMDVLPSLGRSNDIAPEDDVYGWLVGSWELDTKFQSAAGDVHRGKGEVHFSWVLEGRAILDVWITPRRTERQPSMQGINLYGMTFRVYDPTTRTWRVTWFNPVNGERDELIGRWDGNDILQEGNAVDGGTIRWTFTDITPDSFRWLGERLEVDGKTWRLEAEFLARRVR